MEELMNTEKQEMIANIKNDIVLEHNAISRYGNDVSKKLTNFSTEILKSVKLKDSPEVEELLLSLVGELNSMDCTTLVQKKKGFLSRLFGEKDPKAFIAKYESVHSFII